jgi:hypothetical protein
MKTLIVIVLLMVGGVIHADAVFARGAGSGAGAAGAGAGAAAGAAGAGAAAGTPGPGAAAGAPAAADGEAAPGDADAASGPGAGGDSSTVETGPGDHLGGPAAGFAHDPSIYRSPSSAWPGEIEYPSASPRGPAVIAPPPLVAAPSAVIVTPVAPVVRSPERVDTLTAPLMCPGINPSDPRKC